MKNVLILANPSSGKECGEEISKLAQEIFEGNECSVTIQLTQEDVPLADLPEVVHIADYDTCIIIGGDGTVSEFAQTLKTKKKKPAIGIVPAGTVNNVAHALGMPDDPAQAIHTLIRSNEKKIDVGQVNDRLFMSSISAGALPETIWEVSKEQKDSYGPLAYFLEGLKTLNKEETYLVEFELDGEKFEYDLNLFIIGVSDTISGLNRFFDGASYDDGKLHLFCLKPSTLREKFSAFSHLFMDNEKENKEHSAFMLSFKQATIRVKNNHSDVHVALDGEKGPLFPLTVEAKPGFITVLVPA